MIPHTASRKDCVSSNSKIESNLWRVVGQEIKFIRINLKGNSSFHPQKKRHCAGPKLLLLFRCVWLFETPWTVARQAPLSMGFSRQEYWSGLPFPSPRNLPDPGHKPASPALAGWFFTAETPQQGKRIKEANSEQKYHLAQRGNVRLTWIWT